MSASKNEKLSVGRWFFSRLLHTYFLLTRGLTVGVRAIVRADDGSFLLVRHTYTPGWHFPGGGVEIGESVFSALRKELRQETGLQLSSDPKLHGVFHNKSVNGRDHVLVFLCDVTDKKIERKRSIEIAEVGFFDCADLPLDIESGTLRRIREITAGSTPSRLW